MYGILVVLLPGAALTGLYALSQNVAASGAGQGLRFLVTAALVALIAVGQGVILWRGKRAHGAMVGAGIGLAFAYALSPLLTTRPALLERIAEARALKGQTTAELVVPLIEYSLLCAENALAGAALSLTLLVGLVMTSRGGLARRGVAGLTAAFAFGSFALCYRFASDCGVWAFVWFPAAVLVVAGLRRAPAGDFRWAFGLVASGAALVHLLSIAGCAMGLFEALRATASVGFPLLDPAHRQELLYLLIIAAPVNSAALIVCLTPALLLLHDRFTSRGSAGKPLAIVFAFLVISAGLTTALCIAEVPMAEWVAALS